jgi:hypothetical protein
VRSCLLNRQRLFRPAISEKDALVNLHFILYADEWSAGKDIVINEYNKRLTMKDWNEFTQAMLRADFWGLKGINGAAAGLDGDVLIVSGYIKRDTYNRISPRFNLVKRWLVHRTSPRRAI